MKLLLGISSLSLLCALPAANAITVNGLYDPAFGSPTAIVGYDASAPSGNFGNPTSSSNAIGYSIYLDNSAGTLYGLLVTSGPGTSVGSFANVYFGNAANGSTIGFEITNGDAFTPGVPNSNILVPLTYATTSNSVEFAIPDSYFDTTLSGPNLSDPTTTTTVSAGYNAGDTIELRLSQSFGYSVAGGRGYGDDRLGTFTLQAAVPEPSTWAMMMLGFFGLGFMAYRRKAAVAFRFS